MITLSVNKLYKGDSDILEVYSFDCFNINLNCLTFMIWLFSYFEDPAASHHEYSALPGTRSAVPKSWSPLFLVITNSVLLPSLYSLQVIFLLIEVY